MYINLGGPGVESSSGAPPGKDGRAAQPGPVNFEVSRPKMGLILIAVSGLLALGLFNLLDDGATPKGQFWSGVLVVFFGLALPDFIRDLFIPGPILSIDRKGIWDRRFSTVRIPWHEIGEITLRKYKMNKMIGIEVAAPERYLRPLFTFRGFFARLNPILRFPKMTLPTFALTGSAEEIFAAIERHRIQASEDSSSRR
jgi:hypothetical protein